MKNTTRGTVFITVTILSAAVAEAHLIGGSGIASGILHPLLGIDHLLAMVAVGIASMQQGGRATWLLPATFVSFMLLGGILAISGVSLPLIETGIAVSLLILGIAIATAKKIPLGWGVAAVAVFALFHGHAHGNELPQIASPLWYALGFAFTTAILHAAGVLAGYSAAKNEYTIRALRIAGAGMSALGVVFLISVL